MKQLFSYPIIHLINLITWMPSLGVLVLLALDYPFPIKNLDEAMIWFTLSGRIGYYFLLRIVSDLFEKREIKGDIHRCEEPSSPWCGCSCAGWSRRS